MRERFPWPVYLLLSAGLSLTGQTLGGRFEITAVLLGTSALLLFFWQLRLMDELKDYRKDLVAHPERPLPRGLLGTAEVARAVSSGSLVMAGWVLLVWLVSGPEAGACFLLVTVWLWLMFREFYVGAWLERRPLVYALSHQAILFPICGFCVALAAPGQLLDVTTAWFGLAALGAFFAYEVCRKLDPEALPVLGTYLVTYGRLRTFAIVMAALAISAVGAYGLGLQAWLWPVEALLLLAVAATWSWPGSYALPETVAGVSLVWHLWAIPLKAASCSLLGGCTA